MFTLRQYLFSLEDPFGLCRTLRDFSLERDASGRVRYTVGNAAVTFPIQMDGHRYALRCYFSPSPRLKQIYGEEYLERELFLYDAPPHGRWVDVVLTSWVEGEEMASAIKRAAEAYDRTMLSALAERFDRLAIKLLEAPWAHGDLKPENIIVDPAGELHLIDRDAMFLPEMAGEKSAELGTAAYQHPLRSADDFDATIDDFSVALISSALHALALDPTLYERFGERDGLLINPQQIAEDEAFQAILQRFEEEGLALRYRIARTLLRRRPSTLRCQEFFSLLGKPFAGVSDEIPELFFSSNGLWGFRTEEAVTIPPLYDAGWDFSEGLAAVRLGQSWHFIDPTGRVVLHCPPCREVKPFRNGRATIYTDNESYQIDFTGKRFEF